MRIKTHRFLGLDTFCWSGGRPVDEVGIKRTRKVAGIRSGKN